MACNHKFQNELSLQGLDYVPTTLIVGTFNPEWPEGNNARWFYGRTDNNYFWDLLPKMFGDEGLGGFSERIRNVLRSGDALCRLGGEEFVLISERTELQDAVRIAERIRLTVSSTPFSTQAGPVEITCSLGVMTVDESDRGTVDDLLSRADEWMYAAKAAGRNCVRSPLNV